MSLDQQCRWMESTLNENIIDAIIWPSSREQHDCDWIYTLVADVGSRESPLRHDKRRTISAISRVLERF
jgi:hypothetical protein